MECPVCGYIKTAFEIECPRCSGVQNGTIKLAVNINPPAPPSTNSESSRAVVIGITIMVLAIIIIAITYMNGINSIPGRKKFASAKEPAVAPQFPPRVPRNSTPQGNEKIRKMTYEPQPDNSLPPGKSQSNNIQPQSLPPDPAPRAPVNMRGRAHIEDAHISFENDGHGHEQAIRRVLIVNDGPYSITDFRLGLKVLASEYSLVPFEGSISYPRSLLSRRIEPGGTLDVPVMTTGVYASYSIYGSKEVTLEATLDGPPGIVTDVRNMQ